VLGWVAQKYPQLVRAIAAAGHEIASHGTWHELVYDITPNRFREDVRASKDTLEHLAGARVLGYRAPNSRSPTGPSTSSARKATCTTRACFPPSRTIGTGG
jgi:peptidoglycan/xylan/chitin deacetylase (PgdA/CDA1 family)